MNEIPSNNGWTIESYIAYNEAMRAADEKLRVETDRRYAEVNVEKEKALKIKETADLAALELARESQKYKEERNDAMREQSIGDRGAYATHADVAMVVDRMERALKPLVEFVNSQQGADRGISETTNKLNDNIGLIIALVGVAFLVINKFF